jgi:hypothetical protein
MDNVFVNIIILLISKLLSIIILLLKVISPYVIIGNSRLL